MNLRSVIYSYFSVILSHVESMFRNKGEGLLRYVVLVYILKSTAMYIRNNKKSYAFHLMELDFIGIKLNFYPE